MVHLEMTPAHIHIDGVKSTPKNKSCLERHGCHGSVFMIESSAASAMARDPGNSMGGNSSRRKTLLSCILNLGKFQLVLLMVQTSG